MENIQQVNNNYYNYILLDPRKPYDWEFKSMKEAYDFLGEKNKGRINAVLRGERNTYKGYYWTIED